MLQKLCKIGGGGHQQGNATNGDRWPNSALSAAEDIPQLIGTRSHRKWDCKDKLASGEAVSVPQG